MEKKISQPITRPIVVVLAGGGGKRERKKKMLCLILSDTDRFGTSSFSTGDMSDFS